MLMLIAALASTLIMSATAAPSNGVSPLPVQTYGEHELLLPGPIVFDGAVARAADPEAVTDAEAGKRDTVNAAWWGFDEADSTAALQAAINSGAERVLVPNMGRPWIVLPIDLQSDQEILFEDGVVILAKRGAYKGVADILLSARGKQNITLRGYGATLRMHRADYAGEGYDPAEWRHTLALFGCSNVRISGLTLEESGGDGIYLGPGSWSRPGYGPYEKGLPGFCRNVHIRDVIARNHHRQGCSITSARDVLIEGSRFIDTRGTAPQAGIDFEPNSPKNLLVNLVVRDSLFEGNAGSGIEFHFGKLAAESAPVSIWFEGVQTRNNKPDVYFSSTLGGENMPRGSRIVFSENCEVDMGAVRLGVSKPKPSTISFGTEASAREARSRMPNVEVRFDVPAR